jgi:hypothetical protein
VILGQLSTSGGALIMRRELRGSTRIGRSVSARIVNGRRRATKVGLWFRRHQRCRVILGQLSTSGGALIMRRELGRPRKYKNRAEKDRAYRERKKARVESRPVVSSSPQVPRDQIPYIPTKSTAR